MQYHFLEQWPSTRAGLYAAAIKFCIPYVLLMYRYVLLNYTDNNLIYLYARILSTIAFVIALTTLIFTSQFHTADSVFSVVGGVIFLLAVWAVFARQVVHILYSIIRWRPFRAG